MGQVKQEQSDSGGGALRFVCLQYTIVGVVGLDLSGCAVVPVQHRIRGFAPGLVIILRVHVN